MAYNPIAELGGGAQLDAANTWTATNVFTGGLQSTTTPTVADDVINLSFFQAHASGITLAAVATFATTNITLSGFQTINGVDLSTSDNKAVLLTGQSDNLENGIWVAASGAWARRSDCAVGTNQAGTFVPILGGTGENNIWQQTANPAIVGTNALDYTLYSYGGAIQTDGQGLAITGNILSMVLDGGTLSKSNSGVKIADSGITNTQVSASAGILFSKMATLTASMALVTNASGVVIPSSVTSTELGYISGVTSAIQTQINTINTSLATKLTDVQPVANQTTRSAAGTVITIGTVQDIDTSANVIFNIAKLNAASNQLYIGAGSTQTIFNSPNTLTANRTVTLPNANSNTVCGVGSAIANSWVQYIGTDGVQNIVQPGFSNLSGSLNLATQVTGTLPRANGGTGLSTAPTDGQLLIGNTATGGYSLATLTEGANITITNAGGSITIASSGGSGGVPSVQGSANQILINGGTGVVTTAAVFTLPQSIGTSSAVRFGTLAIGAALATNCVASFTSNNSALGLPSLTTTQKNSISPAFEGSILYDSTLKDVQFYNGTGWVGAGGVTTAQGTANMVLVNGSVGSPVSGAITLTLPQALGTSSAVTHGTFALGGSSGGSICDIQGTVSGAGAVYGTLIRSNVTETGSGSGTSALFIGGTHTINGSGTNAATWVQIAPTVTATTTCSSLKSLHIFGASGSGTVTEAYSLYVAAPTVGTAKYTAYFDSKVGIAVNPINALDVNGGLALGSYAGSASVSSGSMVMSGKLGVGVSSIDGNAFVQIAAGSNAFTTFYSGTHTGVVNNLQTSILSLATLQPASGNAGISAHFLNQGKIVAPSGQTIAKAASFYGAADLSSNVGTITEFAQFWASSTNTPAGTVTTNYGGKFELPAAGTYKIPLWTHSLCVNMGGFNPGTGIGYFNSGVAIGTTTAPATGGIMLNSGYIQALTDIRIKPNNGGAATLYLCPDITAGNVISIGEAAAAACDVQIYHVSSTSGATTKQSHALRLIGGYWNGSADTAYSYTMLTNVSANTPAGRLSFYNNNSVEIASFTSLTSNNSGTGITLNNFNSDSAGAYLQFKSAHGNAGSPSATLLGDYLGAVGVVGYGTTGYADNLSVIAFTAGAGWSDTSCPTQLDIILPSIAQTAGLSRLTMVPDTNAGFITKIQSSTFSVSWGTDVVATTDTSCLADGNSFHVVGASGSTSSFQHDKFGDGARITLRFNSTGLTLNNNVGSRPTGYYKFKLAGNTNFSPTAGACLILQKDVQNSEWFEISRTSF